MAFELTEPQDQSTVLRSQQQESSLLPAFPEHTVKDTNVESFLVVLVTGLRYSSAPLRVFLTTVFFFIENCLYTGWQLFMPTLTFQCKKVSKAITVRLHTTPNNLLRLIKPFQGPDSYSRQFTCCLNMLFFSTSREAILRLISFREKKKENLVPWFTTGMAYSGCAIQSIQNQ